MGRISLIIPICPIAFCENMPNADNILTAAGLHKSYGRKETRQHVPARAGHFRAAGRVPGRHGAKWLREEARCCIYWG